MKGTSHKRFEERIAEMKAEHEKILDTTVHVVRQLERFWGVALGAGGVWTVQGIRANYLEKDWFWVVVLSLALLGIVQGIAVNPKKRKP